MGSGAFSTIYLPKAILVFLSLGKGTTGQSGLIHVGFLRGEQEVLIMDGYKIQI